MNHTPNDDCKEAGFTCDFTNVFKDGKCPCAEMGNASVIYNSMKERFNDWFTGILLEQKTCLQRDVLHDVKGNLWKAWQERNP